MITPDIIYLFYDSEYNVFIDEDALIVPNMLEYVTANDLFLFRRGKRDAMQYAKYIGCTITSILETTTNV